MAEAAKPMLGQTGITIAALLSTFSAINASLYGGSRVNYEIAEDDEIPHEFTSQIWNEPVGLFITAVATLILVNTLDLESISTAGSIGFLVVFAAVNYTGFKLSKEISGTKFLSLAGFILCIAALVALVIQQFSSNLLGVLVSGGIILLCFGFEYWFKKSEKLRIKGEE